MSRNRFMLVLGLLVAVSMLIAACGPQIVSTEPATGGEEPARLSFSVPHPILGDIRIRQALALCTDKPSLIAAAYPLNDPEQNAALVMDTFIPTSHWAYAKDDPNIESYDFDPEAGMALIEEAGYVMDENTGFYAKDGNQLLLHFTTTNAVFRQTWAAVWEKQMSNCGVLIIRQHTPGSWWFGDTTGLAVRDFELGAFAWVGQPDPGGETLYSCAQIPTVENGFSGQNDMGWCNQLASDNIKIANNTLVKQERIDAYQIVQEEFTKDMVSIPLFNRASYYAFNPGFNNLEIFPGDQDYYMWNAEEWFVTNEDGTNKDTIVLGFTQEPSTLFQPIVDAFVAKVAGYIISGLTYTSHNYDFQARQMKQLATLESGAAINEDIEVVAGDTVVDVNGEVVVLDAAADPAIEIRNAAGEVVTFTGDPITMKQMTVTYEFNEGLTFSDGVPLAQEDLELGYQIQCDRAIGATSYILCDMVKDITFDGLSYTVVTWPGRQDPLYFLHPFGWYPAHQVIETEGEYQGLTLAEVPAAAWATLPEVAEKPMDVGPYMLTEWEKGLYLKFEANPYFCPACVGNEDSSAPVTPTIILSIVTDENAEAQLLSGQIDLLDATTLVSLNQTLQAAGEAGDITILVAASTTWEHIDMNLFVK